MKSAQRNTPGIEGLPLPPKTPGKAPPPLHFPSRQNGKTEHAKDLLRLSPVRWLVHSPIFPSAFQILNLIILTLLIYFTWGHNDEGLRYTNVGSWVVWVIWWPAVIASAFFAGRIWCTVCHLRLIADWISAIGLKKAIPPWLERHGKAVTLAMLVGLLILHSSVVSFDVHHYPHCTAIYLLLLMGYALSISLIFKKGSFCRIFCPLVAFFGPYSRLSPIELRRNQSVTCTGCQTGEHTKGCHEACPNTLSPATLRTNESCLLCFNCVKSCQNNNIRWDLRSPLKELCNNNLKPLTSVFALLLILGILFQEIGEEWHAFEAATLAFPHLLYNIGLPETILGGYLWIETLWVNLLLPALLVSAAGILAFSLARKGSIIAYIRVYGMALLPLVFCGHLSKLLQVLNTKIGYFSNFFSDPWGYVTASQLRIGLSPPPTAVVPSFVSGWILIALLSVGTIVSLYAAFKISAKIAPHSLANRIFTATPFAIMILFCGTSFMVAVHTWLVA